MSNVQTERKINRECGWPNADPSYRLAWPLPDYKNMRVKRVINLEQNLLDPGGLADDRVLKWKNGTGRNAQWIYLPTDLLHGMHQSDDEHFILYIRVDQDDPLSMVLVNVTVSESHRRLWENFKAITEWTRDDVSRCIAEYCHALLGLGNKTSAGVPQRQNAI